MVNCSHINELDVKILNFSIRTSVAQVMVCLNGEVGYLEVGQLEVGQPEVSSVRLGQLGQARLARLGQVNSAKSGQLGWV